MKWQREPPTEQGRYWYSEGDVPRAPEVVEVYSDRDGLSVAYCGSRHRAAVSRITGEAWWAGPIPEPDEA